MLLFISNFLYLGLDFDYRNICCRWIWIWDSLCNFSIGLYSKATIIFCTLRFCDQLTSDSRPLLLCLLIPAKREVSSSFTSSLDLLRGRSFEATVAKFVLHRCDHQAPESGFLEISYSFFLYNMWHIHWKGGCLRGQNEVACARGTTHPCHISSASSLARSQGEEEELDEALLEAEAKFVYPSQ